MMYNDEIYNNGGRSYFDFLTNSGILYSSILGNAGKKSSKVCNIKVYSYERSP